MRDSAFTFPPPPPVRSHCAVYSLTAPSPVGRRRVHVQCRPGVLSSAGEPAGYPPVPPRTGPGYRPAPNRATHSAALETALAPVGAMPFLESNCNRRERSRHECPSRRTSSLDDCGEVPLRYHERCDAAHLDLNVLLGGDKIGTIPAAPTPLDRR